MLNPKSGDRSGLSPHMRAELEAAGYEPQDGMQVRLVDPQSDLDDDGRVCDMAVDARIVIQPDGAWTAVWDWDAVDWIPT